jgi:4-hydroxybenzoate polyprenyltransferase
MAIGGDLKRALVFSLAVSCLASFGFLLNDLWDRQIDRLNKAGHFEHSGALAMAVGILGAILFLLGGILLSFWLGPSELRLGIGIAVALVTYSVFLRKVLLVPTLVAAVLAATPLWGPLLLWTKTFDHSRWAFVVAIILMILGREILMDVRDRYGDVLGGRETLPTVFGLRIAKTVAILLSISASLILIASISSRFASMSTQGAVGSAIITGMLLYLVLQSAVQTLNTDDRQAIQHYVFRSRIAMALTPLLLLFWNF